MIEVDTSELKKYVKNLKDVAKDAYPKTVRSTLERMGFETTKEYKANVRKNLTIRGNKKTNIVVASIGYEKPSSSLKINDMQCVAGQKSMKYGKKTEQLKKQEFGEPVISKTKYTVKPTKFSRDNSFKKLVSRKNFLIGLDIKRIDDLTNRPAKTPKAQFRQAVGIAHRILSEGEYIHFLPDQEISGKKFGVFRIYNKGSVKGKDGKYKSKGKSIKFMYSFKDRTQAIDPKPMLEPATQTILSKSGEIFVKEAERRISKELGRGLKT